MSQNQAVLNHSGGGVEGVMKAVEWKKRQEMKWSLSDESGEAEARAIEVYGEKTNHRSKSRKAKKEKKINKVKKSEKGGGKITEGKYCNEHVIFFWVVLYRGTERRTDWRALEQWRRMNQLKEIRPCQPLHDLLNYLLHTFTLSLGRTESRCARFPW